MGYGSGLAAMFLRPRKAAGREGYARPNMSIVAGIATENGTWAAFAGDSSHWFDDRVQSLAAGGAGQINLDFYGLGNSSESLDEPVRYSLDFSLALMQGSWKIKPKSPWSVGLRYIYSQVEPKLRDELGATEEFERFQQVIMGWVPLADRWTLGLRADYQWSSDGTPFFLRPYIKLRGVVAMRYQGDEMASAEVEARWQVRGRWSLVGAAGYGTARTDRVQYSATRDVVSGAVGFRYELARKFGLHAGMDVGFSSDTTAVYFQIGNAWFRP